MLEEINERYSDEVFETIAGFDGAVIGLDETSMRLIYSTKKGIEILVTQGMEYDEAVEFFIYNLSSAFTGEKQPIWCADNFEENL